MTILEKLKKEKGITLIALIITVIIMLILAGVAIATVIDGDGLFNRVRQVAGLYNEAVQQEENMIQDMLNQIDIYMEGTNIGENEEDKDTPPIEENPVVKPPAIIGTIVTENQTYDGRLEGTFNNPIIPKGFSPENENNAIWGTSEGYQKGLVIRDSSGNEFVWVPVDGIIIKFERYDYWKGSIIFSECTETLPIELTTSVENNGGFYIARYEAGQLVNGKTVSKQGAMVYNNATWETSKTLAEAMYSKDNENYGIISTLIYGTQWDTTLKFIETYNVGETGYDTYVTNSTGMGNYSGTNGGDTTTATPATCGLLSAFRQKNIYDMAGNVYEWTMEEYNQERIARGGYFVYSGEERPVSSRGSGKVDVSAPGGRVQSSTLYK